MVQLNWTQPAINDLHLIAEYISKDSVAYAEKIVNHILNKVEVLSKFPLIGRVIPEKEHTRFREIIVGNYRIMYKIVSKSRVDILAVHHGARLFKDF